MESAEAPVALAKTPTAQLFLIFSYFYNKFAFSYVLPCKTAWKGGANNGEKTTIGIKTINKITTKIRTTMAEVINIKELNERIERESVFVDTLRREMGKVIVGQQHLVDTLLIGLLSNGHILLEGVPGLAKTLAITTLAKAVDANFSRIQFTPDLLPADLLGTLIYSQKSEDFIVKKGPVFANFVLADEINRSPAKVQSALLEAMQERQVTIGDETYPLPQPFLVLATQNPLEQEGTYPLPEAQVDRFLMRLSLGYARGGKGDHARGYRQGPQGGGGCLYGREDREVYRRHHFCHA